MAPRHVRHFVLTNRVSACRGDSSYIDLRQHFTNVEHVFPQTPPLLLHLQPSPSALAAVGVISDTPSSERFHRVFATHQPATPFRSALSYKYVTEYSRELRWGSTLGLLVISFNQPSARPQRGINRLLEMLT